MLIKPFFLAIGWSYLHELSHTFLKRLKLLWVEIACKSASFSTDNGQTTILSIFTAFLTTKTSSQNISITLLQISLKLHKHRGRFWRKKLPWTILKEQFPVPRYTAASKIGNSVISLLWQLRCRCNPNHNKFSSLSNTTAAAIFPKLCLWPRSLCSNLGGIGLEKLYRATLSKCCINKLHSHCTCILQTSFPRWGICTHFLPQKRDLYESATLWRGICTCPKKKMTNALGEIRMLGIDRPIDRGNNLHCQTYGSNFRSGFPVEFGENKEWN